MSTTDYAATAAGHLVAIWAETVPAVAALPWPAVVAWLAMVATAAAHEHAPAPAELAAEV